MNEIKELDQRVIDKIAAGEVVERPASVVKELVENSIDAGSTAISVEIEGGGIDLIRVTDNGSGIASDQIELAFTRHATSKIRSDEELKSISSLGFRGEALSSIAAVSKTEVFTKGSDQMAGAYCRIEGGVIKEKAQKAAPDGTTFIVRSLFYNTPARRKFLKSPVTEGNYIRELIEKLAISHPEIAFKFRSNKADKFITVGDGKLLNAVYCVYGRGIAAHLLELDTEACGIRIRGFIGKSELNRGNRTMEIFFVNERLVKSNILSKAIEDGGEGYVMKHQYPFAILFIDLDRSLVDVNVHPGKQEVRFMEEPAVYQALSQAVHDAYHRGDMERSTGDLEEKSAFAPELARANESTDESRPKSAPEPFEKDRLQQIKESIREQISKDSPYERKYDRKEVDSFLCEHKGDYTDESKEKSDREFLSGDNGQISPERRDILDRSFEQSSFISKDSIENHRLIGPAFDTYWIFEYNDALYLVDQHAAHEKVNYERLMRGLSDQTMTSESISPPIIMTLTVQEKQAVSEHIDAFEELGFRISDFGEREVALEAVPGNLFDIDPEELFTNVLSDIDSWNKSGLPRIVRERIATIACKASVKGNQRISAREMEHLFVEMMKADEPFHCPHGRPTVIRLTKAEIDRRFKRIVG